MKRFALGSALGLAALAGCASLIDINDYEAPPADAGMEEIIAEAGADASDASCGPARGDAQNLAPAPLGLRIALDDENVYFAHAEPPRNSAILRCSKCGCQTPESLASLGQPGTIAVDDKYVFYTDNLEEGGTLNRLDKKTLDRQQIPDQILPLGVALDDTYVYWTVIGNNDISTAGVWRAKKEDLGSRQPIARTQDDPANPVPYAIAVDATYVYFTTTPDIDNASQDLPCTGSNGTVQRILKNKTPITIDTLATGQPCPVALTVDGDNLYWLNLGAGTTINGSLWSVPKSSAVSDSGATPDASLVIGDLGRPTSLTSYGGRLTWTAPAGQRVETCKPPGCSTNVTSLASLQANPSAVAADPTGIYWVDLGTTANLFGDGALRRAPSPP